MADYVYQNLRVAIIKKYGGKCAHCGFSDWRALQVDHVKGGGTAATNRHGLTSKSDLRRILNDTNGNFQLLCANCNCIKKYEKLEGVSFRTNGEMLRHMERFSANEPLVVSFC